MPKSILSNALPPRSYVHSKVTLSPSTTRSGFGGAAVIFGTCDSMKENRPYYFYLSSLPIDLDSCFDHCLTINGLLIWGAGFAQWRKHAHPTSAAVPRIDSQTGVILLLVPVLASRGFSPSTPVFLSPQKQTFPNSNPDSNFIRRVSLISQVLCANDINIYMNLFIYIVLMRDFFA